MKHAGAVSSDSEFLNAVLERERLGSTAIGKGVAVPHARTHHIKKITIAIARLQDGIEFGSGDGSRVDLIFLLGTPKVRRRVSECVVQIVPTFAG